MATGKRATALVGCIILGASVLGSASAQNAKPEPKGGYTVGFVTAAIGAPFYQSMKCGAEQAAREHHINLIWQGSQSISPRDEMQVFDAVVAQRPDGMLLVPWDSAAFIAPTKKLMDGGTPVITADGRLTEKADIQNLRTDNHAAGIASAKALAEMIGGKGTVLILTASPGDQVQNDRWKGFKEVLDHDYKDIKVLDPQYVGSDAGKAASVGSSMIAAHPELTAIYATQETSAEGASNAVRAAGKREQIKVVGWNTTQEQIDMLKAGDFDALVAQSPYSLGTEMVTSMAKVLKEGRDKAALPYEVFAPFKFVTRDNADDADTKHFIYATKCE